MSNRSNTSRLALTASLALAIGLASAASASATVTIGQLGVPPPGECSGSASEFAQPTVTSGNTYVVPAGGEKITGWSINAPSGAGQIVTMKIYRVAGTTYTVVGHDGPRNLTASVQNNFPADISVKPGDVLGLSHASGSSTGCAFPVPGENGQTQLLFSDLSDGQSGTFGPSGGGFRLNIEAQVAIRPSNDFTLGKLKKNKNKGTALLTVDVPGPGTLTLGGTGVKAQRSAGATISKEVAKAGPVTLKIKAKGKKKTKLLDRGKVKVKAKVTYTPNGDLPGVPSIETKKVKLVDN
jgi:hypothetical protein